MDCPTGTITRPHGKPLYVEEGKYVCKYGEAGDMKGWVLLHTKQQKEKRQEEEQKKEREKKDDQSPQEAGNQVRIYDPIGSFMISICSFEWTTTLVAYHGSIVERGSIVSIVGNPTMPLLMLLFSLLIIACVSMLLLSLLIV